MNRTCVVCHKVQALVTSDDESLAGPPDGWRAVPTRQAKGGYVIRWHCEECWRALRDRPT